jgi:hypothetical protein
MALIEEVAMKYATITLTNIAPMAAITLKINFDLIVLKKCTHDHLLRSFIR